jgi:hypothetical protein
MDDERWQNLEGGYRVPYDPRPALARLQSGDGSAWEELWTELHHQGDVGVASYASVPQLVHIHRDRDVPEWQTYALIGTIETCRRQRKNPSLPEWLTAEYQAAWDAIVPLACRDLPRATDETTVRAIIGAVAIAKGLRPLGDLILNFTGDELLEMVEAYESLGVRRVQP